MSRASDHAEESVAVLLAAGAGRRLGQQPKALFPVGDTPLIDRAVRALEAAGVGRLVVVTGYAADRVEAHVARSAYRPEIEFVHNERYADLNNFYSLYVACAGGRRARLIVLNCDIVFAPELLPAALKADADLVLLVEEGRTDPEALKVELDGDGELALVRRLGKQIPAGDAAGEFIGISLLTPGAAAEYAREAASAAQRGEVDLYYEDVYSRLCGTVQTRAVRVPAGSWAEIDTPEDVPEALRVAASVDRPHR